MEFNNMHKEKVEDRGYEYICSYVKDEITIDGKINKYKYIRVKCPYCRAEYDVTYGAFIYKKRNCTHCCNKYEDSFAYHIQQELGEPLNKYWDWEKNTINPYLISRRNDKKVYIKCTKTNYHNSTLMSCANFTKGDRCSYCNRRKIHPKDSFAQYHIDNTDKDFLEKYWSDKNILNPWNISSSCAKKIWIKCQEKDHHDDYMTSCDSFTRGCRCPQCCNFQGNVHPKDSFAQWGIDNLGNDFLEKYWSIKNTQNPFELSKYTQKKVWAKCQNKNYHEDYMISCDNFVNGSRCPYCSHNSGKVHPKDSFGYLYPEKAKYWSSRNYKSPNEVASFSNKKFWFICENCGGEFKRSLNSLNQRDDIVSCSSCSSSKGEHKIKTVCVKYNVNNIPQKEFKGLVGLRGGNLSYDFYLPKYNLLIEYQGKQHECVVEYFHNKKNNFERQLEHDRIKFNYAINNGIDILYIYHWQYNEIEEILKYELQL